MVEAVGQYHDRVRFDVFALVPAVAGNLLDVGGGVGATSASLKDSGRVEQITLLDQVAHASLPQIDKAFAGDLEDPALIQTAIAQRGPFDTILCLDVLEHLRDPWQVVALLGQGLKPGGSLIISLPNMNHLSVVGPLVLRGRFDLVDAGIKDRTHLRWFTRYSAEALATGSGLRLEAVQANVYSRLYRLANRFSFGLFERFFATQYVLRVSRSS